MRHGRKSRSKKIDGYKRHILKDLESGVVCAVALTRANTPESTATVDLERDLKFQNIHLAELHIDRAYLSSHWVTQRDDKLQIFCKAWPVKNSGRFDKNSFFLDWDTHLISCPNQVIIPFEPGKIVHFPQNECAVCPLRSGCTNSKRGRTVSIHPDEALMQELRARQSTAIGRKDLRKRTTVEHSLAHIGHWQGNRARYIGQRKNLFDLRRVAVVHNLHVIARMDRFCQLHQASSRTHGPANFIKSFFCQLLILNRRPRRAEVTKASAATHKNNPIAHRDICRRVSHQNHRPAVDLQTFAAVASSSYPNPDRVRSRFV